MHKEFNQSTYAPAHQTRESVRAESSAAKKVQMSHQMHEIANRKGPVNQTTTTSFWGALFGSNKGNGGRGHNK